MNGLGAEIAKNLILAGVKSVTPPDEGTMEPRGLFGNFLFAETAKNLILAGVKSVTLHDEGTVELGDLSDNFLFAETDEEKNRALASMQKLQQLSNAVAVSTLTK